MDHIKSIPTRDGKGIFWEENPDCGGFEVKDSCPWRYEEMLLVTYTPSECQLNRTLGCDNLVSYARFQQKLELQDEASQQFYTTMFTCLVLTVASLTFANDIEQIVILPIKKIVNIIQRLAEGPLKKPE